MRARLLAIGVTASIAVSACGHSSSSKSSSGTAAGGATPTTGANADLQKKVPVSAPGVTDSSIGVAAVTSTTNILGGKYGDLGDGMQAYFDYVNSQGGIYGRQLKIIKRRDDNFSNNQQTVKASLAEDKPFAMFIASPLFSAAPDLAAAKTPTFIWNINPEFAGHPNFFANVGALNFGGGGQFLPFFAREHGYKTVGLLGYGSTASSKECGEANKKSFEKYPTAKVGFYDNNIAFAQPDLSSQVSAMKKAGVDFISTCMDTKETLVLAKEMQRQGLSAPQVLPNAYDHQFVKDNANVLNGSYVYTLFTPVEAQPQNDEMKTMLEWRQKANKGPEAMRIRGWSLAKEFVDGLKLAGPDFSQAKVVNALNTQTAWDAGGLVRPIDWTRQHNSPEGHPENDYKDDCYTGVVVQNGEFQMALGKDDKPWTCLSGGEGLTAPELTQTPTYKNFAS
jgi:ABC-type branched-subunit amino acid transport system substrate-binding protein